MAVRPPVAQHDAQRQRCPPAGRDTIRSFGGFEITIFDDADYAFFNDTCTEACHARYAAECWTRMLAFYWRHLA